MNNASFEGLLHIPSHQLHIPLDASHNSWEQPIDHRGRPSGKVRAKQWHFVTSRLTQEQYTRLLELMLAPTTVVDAHAEYSRTDGQGVFVTVWGRRCTVCHLFDYFDSRGTNGEAAGWTVYFTLAPEEMGRQAGTFGPFVMPEPRSYAYTGPPTSVVGVVRAKALVNRPLLKNDADPIHDLLGPGRLSHPEEWEATIAMLKNDGVDVVFREGVMAYGPQSASGKAGRLIIDPEASIGALRHETQHYLDDKASGFPGMKILLAPKTRWRMEYAAYMREITFTRELRAFATGKQLLVNAKAEREFIITNYGPVK